METISALRTGMGAITAFQGIQALKRTAGMVCKPGLDNVNTLKAGKESAGMKDSEIRQIELRLCQYALEISLAITPRYGFECPDVSCDHSDGTLPFRVKIRCRELSIPLVIPIHRSTILSMEKAALEKEFSRRLVERCEQQFRFSDQRIEFLVNRLLLGRGATPGVLCTLDQKSTRFKVHLPTGVEIFGDLDPKAGSLENQIATQLDALSI